MVWLIRVLKNDRRGTHLVDECHVALAVAGICLRNGIAVEKIEGPDGVSVAPETIRELGTKDPEAGGWRRSRLKFLSH